MDLEIFIKNDKYITLTLLRTPFSGISHHPQVTKKKRLKKTLNLKRLYQGMKR